MHYILFYDLVDDYISRREPFRAAHLEKIREARERGELVMAGALASPADGAVFVFRGSTARTASQFAVSDPYVTNGLVTSFRVREWATVIGDGAEPPAVAT